MMLEIGQGPYWQGKGLQRISQLMTVADVQGGKIANLRTFTDCVVDGVKCGPDGRLYACQGAKRRLIAITPATGAVEVLTEDVQPNDLAVTRRGHIFFTETGKKQVTFLDPRTREKRPADTGLANPNGITLSPDQTLLYVADYRSHWVYSYAIQPDGTLAHKQRYFHLHSRDEDDESFADGLKVDRDGNLYVATRLGIQICDQAGRVNAIIPTPNGRITNLVFGGENFDTLYASCNDKVYKRKLKVRGTNAWEPPHKPAAPKL